MLRALLLIFIVTISSIGIVYYQNPSVFSSFYALKLVNPRTWGKIEVLEERPIGSIKDVFQTMVIWQVLEQLVAFVTGAVISVLIGWRVGSYRSIYEKSLENSLSECQKRQNTLEKRLGALELQIVHFERALLFLHKRGTVTRSESGLETSTLTEGRSQLTEEGDKHGYNHENETQDKENQTDSDGGLVRQAVEVIMKQDFDEVNFERILEKLTKILERLSNLSKEKIFQESKTDVALGQEQYQGNILEETIEVDALNEECYEKGNLEIENDHTITNEAQGAVCPEEEDQINHQYSNISCEKTSYDYSETPSYDCSEKASYEYCEKATYDCCEKVTYDLHRCKSTEKISDVTISIVGGGECEETFRGKIVPVSQIPRVNYQELRESKLKKPRVKLLREVDERALPSVTCRSTPDQSVSEGSTPQTTPRVNNSSPTGRTASKLGRRKQRS